MNEKKYRQITIGLLLFSASFLLLFKYLSDGDSYLAFFDDDFFYYIQTIKQTFKSGFITFNGIYETNGFHPLWFGVLSLIALITSFGKALFIAVNILTVLMSIVVFRCSFEIFTTKFKLTEIYSLATSLFISLIYLLIAKGGMEVVISIPILIYLINFVLNEKHISSLSIGLLFSLCFLSRLDSVLFLGLLFLYILKLRKDFKILPFVLGVIPSLLYLISNYIIYDTFMPISGMAKQLKTSYLPVLNNFESLIFFGPNQIIYSLIPLFCLVLNLVFVIFKKYEANIKTLTLLSVFFPIIFLTFNSVVSGWIMWPWYYYIFIPSQIMFFVLAYSFVKINSKIILVALSIFVLFWSLSFGLFKKAEDYDIFIGSKKIAEFCAENRGVYAMGDRAGLVSFLIEDPIIQTEGLVMDKQFVNNLKSMNLIPLLEVYKVDYYIANFPDEINDTTWYIQEPHKNHQYQIVSSDTLYSKPLDSVIVKSWKNYIFKMKL